MSDFKFNPAKVRPQTAIEVAPDWKQNRATKPQTNAERIASAKARAMQLCKDSNSVGGEYGFGDDSPTYYQDFAGPDTSAYEFNHLLFVLYFLDDPNFGTGFFEAVQRNDYNNRTGIWVRGGSHIPIQDLKDAVSERIAALGISEVLLLEHLAVPHDIAESQAFCKLSFDQQMARFRSTKLV